MDSSKLPLPEIFIHDINKSRSTIKIAPRAAAIGIAMRRLAVYRNLPEKSRRGLEAIGDYVRDEMIPRTFDAEGPGWKPLSQRAQTERWMDGFDPEHPILQRTGDLFDELTSRAHPKHIEIIKTGSHARIEIGGSSRKFIENQMGVREKRLPQRSMMPGTGNIPINDRDKAMMKDMIIKAIQQKQARPNG